MEKRKALTRQEQLVIELAGAGLVDKEISAQLKISVNTLRTYWNRIRLKNGNQTRTKLVLDEARQHSLAASNQVSFLEKRIHELEIQASTQKARAAVIEVERVVVVASLLEIDSDLKRAQVLLKLWGALGPESSGPEGLHDYFCWLAKLLLEVGGYSCVRLSMNLGSKKVLTFPAEFEGRNIFPGVLDLEELCQQQLTAIIHSIQGLILIEVSPLKCGSFWPIMLEAKGVGVLSVFSRDIDKLRPGDDAFFLDVSERLGRVIAKERVVEKAGGEPLDHNSATDDCPEEPETSTEAASDLDSRAVS